MTRDGILAMETGPELNALIAVELMGWQRQEETPPGYVCHEGGRDWISPDGKDWWCNHCGQEDGFPDFSGSISAAWDVVEKLMEQNMWWASEYYRHDDPPYDWAFCKPRGDNGAFRYYDAKADALPLAICRAALLAVMETP